LLKGKAKVFDFGSTVLTSIDGSETLGEFKDYQFLNRTVTEKIPAVAE